MGVCSCDLNESTAMGKNHHMRLHFLPEILKAAAGTIGRDAVSCRLLGRMSL